MPRSPNAKPISIKKYSKVHTYHDAYDDVVKILRRLEKRGEVKCHPANSRWEPNLWSLPSTKPVSPEKRAHDLDITDLYKSYWPFYPNELKYWDWRWQADEIAEYKIHTRDSFLFDARMNFKDTWIFWEVNRGSKGVDALRDQVKGYYDFSKAYPRIRFHVIWTLQYERQGIDHSPEDRKKHIRADAKILLAEFENYQRGDQFLVARHSEVLTDPRGAIFVSATDPTTPKSLDAITS